MPVNTVPNGGTGFVTGERIRLNRVRNLPLILTLFRLALGPIFLFSVEVGPWLMSVIVAMAIVTDWLDGFLARRWKAVSVSGKLLDPFADALFCMMAFWACWRSPLAILSGWLFGVLVGREALVTFVVRPVALLRGVQGVAFPDLAGPSRLLRGAGIESRLGGNLHGQGRCGAARTARCGGRECYLSNGGAAFFEAAAPMKRPACGRERRRWRYGWV